MTATLTTKVFIFVLQLHGQEYVYAVPKSFVEGRSPDDLTLAEWRKFPALSGIALFQHFLNRRAAGKAEGAP